MKKMNWKNCLTFGTIAALSLSLLAGCGASQSSGTQQPASENEVAGTVLLSVNPEIEVEYDNGGQVLEIEGLNEDGKTVVAGFEDYKGKDCRTVVNELVKEIYASGYFTNTVDGHTKNIVLKMEEGSAYPDDNFLEEVAEGVREAVNTCGIASETMTVREDDLDDGVYEFEFLADGVEYEYEVDARTGKILEADFDGNDDWDDRDQWDDWDELGDRDDTDDDQDDADADDQDDTDDDQDDNDDDHDDAAND